jgi:Spy/CpxP family protein refolding chaperone
MIRKTLLALSAAVALGALAFAPTAASAKGFHHHGFHGGFGFWGPGYTVTDDCYLVKQPTRNGYRYIQVCG